MLNSVNYVNYGLVECKLKRSLGEMPENVILSIHNINFDSNNVILSIKYKIDLLFKRKNSEDKDDVSYFIYNNNFAIKKDSELHKELLSFFESTKEVKDKEEIKMNDDIKNLLLALARMSLPYIRQAFSNVTTTAIGGIFMPLVDTEVLFNSPITFSR